LVEMEPEMVEMGKTHVDWAKKYETISKQMEGQAAELRSLYRKVLMMRYETSLLGLHYLKTSKQLQIVKEMAESVEDEQSVEV
jgi:hypothetical protein